MVNRFLTERGCFARGKGPLASSWVRFRMSDILEKIFWFRFGFFAAQDVCHHWLHLEQQIQEILTSSFCQRHQDCVFPDFELKLSFEKLVRSFSILSFSFLFPLFLFLIFSSLFLSPLFLFLDFRLHKVSKAQS